MALLVEGDLTPGSILPPEDEATGSVMVFMFIIAGLVGVAAWLIFVWAVKDRQFDEIEDIAKRVSDLDSHTTTDAASKYQAERTGAGGPGRVG
jgi:cbb3-type cytochrome oxidase maturation protein